MGAGSLATRVTAPPTGNWSIADPAIAGDAQGLVASGYGSLPISSALFIEVSGTAWLQALLAADLISNADKDGAKARNTAVNIAVSHDGLERMGLDGEALATFSVPFTEGMADADRAKALGDDGPTATVEGGLRWSGGGSEKASAVHAIVLLYAADRATLDTLEITVLGLLGTSAVLAGPAKLETHLHPRTFALNGCPRPQFLAVREHFGFADGASQPVPFGKGIAPDIPDPQHGVALGELLIGQTNAYGDRAPGPHIARAGAAAQLAELQPGLSSLGLNGSYLVVRQLRQDVAGFWRSFTAEAERLRAITGDNAVTPLWLAERAVGRGCHGDMITEQGPLAPGTDGPDNRFGFFATDAGGLGCPIGSHVRRANPRDGLAEHAAAAPELLRSVNNHRIMRRGRSYGEPAADLTTADGVERGLLFMCLTADIARQFEFIQQTWLLNPVLGGMMGEADPILGPAAPFSIQRDPVRVRANLARFVQLVGGDYYFLPSLRVLGYLAQLRP